MPPPSAFTVGVTGHRPNRLRVGPAALERQCLDVLASLARGSRGCRHVAVSALAEGADRAFAEAALIARYELWALLPFQSTIYETTFTDRRTLPDYKRLLAAAARADELPGALAAEEASYSAVGAELVRRSDVVVAVWDGEAGRGGGGTPHVMEMALAASKPVIWIDAHGVRPRSLLVSPASDRALPIVKMKGRARKLTPRRCASLAARLVSGLSATTEGEA